MVDSECPEVVTLQDGPLFDLHKVPLALCMQLTEKGLNLREVVWTARQSKSGFYICFYRETMKVDLGKQMKKKKKKRKVASPSKNRDIKKTSQVAEDLSTW